MTTKALPPAPAEAKALPVSVGRIDVAFDMAREIAPDFELVAKLAPQIGDTLAQGILKAEQRDEAGIYDQRERVAALGGSLTIDSTPGGGTEVSARELGVDAMFDKPFDIDDLRTVLLNVAAPM